MDEIVKKIIKFYQECNISYMLNKYIDKNFWDESLNKYFPNNYIENLTDFNYSRCFTIAINISEFKGNLLSKEFDEYLDKYSYLHRLEIQISLIGPYIRYKFFEYEKNELQEVTLKSMDKLDNCSSYLETLFQFIEESKLNLLNDGVLMQKVPGVTLELRGEDVSVYNCLFEDSSSYYPYESN